MDNLHSLLSSRFGFSEFRPGQEEVIASLNRERRALAVFPTGAGKSLCYQLPALMYEGVTLVVSPLIALMKNQIDFLTSKGIASARVDSSLNLDDFREVNTKISNGSLKILYVTPERFNSERFMAVLEGLQISLFAIDEAHCISEWGHNFRPDFLKLAETCRILKVERILALTATATPKVVKDIRAGFDISETATTITGFYRPNLNMATTAVRSGQKEELLLKRLHNRRPDATIIYVTLQKTANRVANFLTEHGFQARPYHAGMQNEERKEIQDWWMERNDAIVVATIAFGMGIDKSDVRYVYHFNLPKSLENYSQEIGRAGRDGQKSTVEMFACLDDLATLENFIYGDTPTYANLSGLVEEIFSGETELNLNFDLLSRKHDLRTLVLRTTLVYLELEGFLKQGAPYYETYAFKTRRPETEIITAYPAKAVALIKNIFKSATKKTTWSYINPDVAAVSLEVPRTRILRALEVMEQDGHIELQVSSVRYRFTVLKFPENLQALTADLLKRFEKREETDIRRLQMVTKLVTHDKCQVNTLVRYFGEVRDTPCGHCTLCVTGKPQHLPPLQSHDPLPAQLDLSLFNLAIQEHPTTLLDPRQQAKFLCGLTSPAFSMERLTRHSLFGFFEERPFAEVYQWLLKRSSTTSNTTEATPEG